MVEHLFDVERVIGSNPVPPTDKNKPNAKTWSIWLFLTGAVQDSKDGIKILTKNFDESGSLLFLSVGEEKSSDRTS